MIAVAGGCGSHSAARSNSLAALLDRPLHFPVLRPGQSCPTTYGTPISNGYFAGVALGHGLVRPLIASAGDVRHGVADLDPANTPGWREFKTLWFSVPAYQGPFVIRAERIEKHGPIRLGGSGLTTHVGNTDRRALRPDAQQLERLAHGSLGYLDDNPGLLRMAGRPTHIQRDHRRPSGLISLESAVALSGFRTARPPSRTHQRRRVWDL